MRKKFSISKKMNGDSSPDKHTTGVYFDKVEFSDLDHEKNSVPPKLLSINKNYPLNSYEYDSIFNQETFAANGIVELVEQNSKKGSISWECLPFSSRTRKQNQIKKNSENQSIPNNKKKKEDATNTINTNNLTITPTTNTTNNNNSIKAINNETKPSLNQSANLVVNRSRHNSKSTDEHNTNSSNTFSVTSSSGSSMIMSETESRPTTTRDSSKTANHHPYATSLVNSGFGFGFDLQGGELDNQLTFIVNVQPNGDAARKGLADGDILVSIQGKNVIGIRRTAIERILKQYKVDQEIEIVVCRLKDPSFILNLSKLITQHQQQQQQSHSSASFSNSCVSSSSSNFDPISKFRNLNEQIFNELAHFEDKSYKKASGLISNMKRSIRKEIFYEERASSSKLRQQKTDEKNYVSETQIALENTHSSKPILISVPINSTSTSNRPYTNNYNQTNAYNLNETNLISIELNKLNKPDTAAAAATPTTISSIINSPVQQALSTHDSGVYNESSSRKSNKSTSYYSDISIVVYDNVANITSSVNSGVNSVSLINTNDKRTIIASSSSSSNGFTNNNNANSAGVSKDRMIVSVTQQPHRRSSTIHPNILSSTRSVNDFTGSIIAADRVNYFNKQVAESSKLNKNINNDSIYSSVMKKEAKNKAPAPPPPPPPATPPVGGDQQRISFCTTSNSAKANESTKFLPITIHESYQIGKKRSASEAVNQKESFLSPVEIEIKNVKDEQENNNKPSPVIVDEFNSRFAKPNLRVNLTEETSSSSSSSFFSSSFTKNNKINSNVNTTIKTNEINESDSNLSSLKSTSRIEQRLIELEKIAKNNIKQLENFEQKYSSSFSSTNRTVSSQQATDMLNKEMNSYDETQQTTRKSTSNINVSSSSYEIPINIQLENDKTKQQKKKFETCQTTTTNVDSNILEKQKRLLEEVNFKPFVKQRLADYNAITNASASTNNSNNIKASLTEANNNNNNNNTNSYLFLSKTAKTKQNQEEISENNSLCSSNSSISKENSEANSLQTTIDIEIYNLEPKFKPIAQHFNEQRQTLTIMPRANRRSKQKPFKIECHEEQHSDSLKEEPQLNVIKHEEESSEACLSPEIQLVRVDDTSDAKSEDAQVEKKTSPKLGGQEKHFKRKPHQRYSQISLPNDQTNVSQPQTKVAKSKREALAQRRDRRSRHTIPFAHSQEAASYDVNNLKEFQQQLVKDAKLKEDNVELVKNDLFSDEVTKLDQIKPEKETEIQVEDETIKECLIESEVLSEPTIDSTDEVPNKIKDDDALFREIKSDSENLSVGDIKADKRYSIAGATASASSNLISLEAATAVALAVATVPKLPVPPVYVPHDSLVNKSLRKKHDSTDTLDSASSYEIRFERPHYAIGSKAELEDSTKAGLWANILDSINTLYPTLDSNTTPTNLNAKQEEEEAAAINVSQSSPLQIESSSLESDPLYLIANLGQTELAANFEELNVSLNEGVTKTKEEEEEVVEVASPESPRYDDEYSSSDAATGAAAGESLDSQLNITKDDTSSLLAVQSSSADDKFDKFNNSTSSFRSVEISPRTKISNEILDDSLSDQLEMTKSVTQIINESSTLMDRQAKEEIKLLDASCISDSSNDVVSSLVDQVETILHEEKKDVDVLEENVNCIKQVEEKNASTVMNAQSIFDDGYGSTASMKNITNESYSSLDDAASECNSHIDTTRKGAQDQGMLQSLLMTKPKKSLKLANPKLESLADDIDQAPSLAVDMPAVLSESAEKPSSVPDVESVKLVDSESEDPSTLVNNETAPSAAEDLRTLVDDEDKSNVSSLILEKTVSYSSELTEKTELNAAEETTTQEVVVLEKLENSLKLVELEPVEASQLKVENNTETESFYSSVPLNLIADTQASLELVTRETSLDVAVDEPAILEQDTTLEEKQSVLEEAYEQQSPIHTIQIEEQTNTTITTAITTNEINQVVKSESTSDLDETEINTKSEDQEEVEEKKEEESMLQEPSIQIKNTTSTPNTVTKHLNGSAVVESTDLAKTLTDVPPVYEKLKPDSIKTAESVVVSPVLPLAPKQFTSQLSQSHAASSPNQASLDKAVSPSLNVSLSNAQDDNRSLSSNEFTNDQALSLSYPVQYKSTIAPRQTVISRRSNNDRMPAVNQSQTLSLSAPISLRPIPSTTALQSPAGSALKETRQREKKQLGELNDRFAGYVERVRFLEAQNKKLQTELSVLKSKWGQETKQIEKMYQIELEEARSVLNDTSKNKDGLQIKLDRYEQELDKIRRKYTEVEDTLEKDKLRISSLQDQIATNESEINLLRRRLADLQDEEKKYKQEIMRMMNEIQKVQFELENEMKQRLMLENDKQSLEEELVFLKEIHAKEIEELKHLSLQESGIDPTMFFKNELSNAIKEIREEYESLNQSQRAELEGWYRIKVEQAVAEIQRKQAQPIASHEATDSLSREQARKLQLQILDSKRNIGDLKAKNAELEIKIRDLEEEIKREEMESNYQIANKDSEIKMLQEHLNRIIGEYEELLTTKSDLEVEIRTYRKLLEGEENKDGLKQIVENIEHRSRGLGSSSNRSFQDTISAGNQYSHFKLSKTYYPSMFFKSNRKY